MPNVTHFLIPFAAPGSEAGRAALKNLSLPQLETLLARLTVTHTDPGDPRALTPPHERELARQWGLPLNDGLLPWAALQAREEGRPLLDQAWARVTPCHWQIGREHIEMLHPQALDLTAEESHGLLHASLESVPLWLDEGLAEYFEVVSSQPGPVNSDYVRLLGLSLSNGWRPDLRGLEELESVNSMRREHYREAWAWVHYMLHGSDEGLHVVEVHARYHACLLCHQSRCFIFFMMSGML